MRRASSRPSRPARRPRRPRRRFSKRNLDLDLAERSGCKSVLLERRSRRSRSGIRAASTWTGSVITRPYPLGVVRKTRPSDRFPAMAVATEREYGLFIAGEFAEPASGEVRELSEPASGEPLARVAMGTRSTSTAPSTPPVRRSKGRGRRRRPTSAPGCSTHSQTRSSRTARSSPISKRGTSARRSRRSRRRSAAPSSTSASSPPRSRRSRAARTPSAARSSSIRRRSPSALRADRPLELPVHDDDVETRARARRRLHDRAEARSANAADRASPRGARGGGRLPAGRRQRRPRRRSDDRLLPRAASGRRQGRVHRLDEDGRRDHAALLRPDQAPDARARRQEPEHRLRRRRPRRRDPERASGRSTTPPARAARRARACSSRRRSTTTSSRSSQTTPARSRSATRSTRRRRWAR